MIELIFFLIGLLVAVTIHEFSHAFMADRLGDPTARLSGRLTLNPLAHLDPLGTIALLIAHFGWGKPVPVDPFNLRHPKRDSALISLAGPLSNLILAVVLALLIRFSYPLSVNLLFSSLLYALIQSIIYINVGLAVFNLLPVPPLDGAKILVGFLPADLATKVEQSLSQFGTILLLLLILPISRQGSLAGNIIMPVINLILGFLL